MARSLRIAFPGALYHISSRGDGRESIFTSDNDRLLFLKIFSEVCERFNWVCYSYCLMSNHYHFLLETPHGNLSKGMQLLNGVYTQKFNKLHDRVGHVFQGRFHSILVDKDDYLLELSRYIVLNPVRAHMVQYVDEWEWSSYQATLDHRLRPFWLFSKKLLSMFSQDEPTAIKKYQTFVEEGIMKSSPWKHIKNQIYLGGDEFVQKTLKKIKLDNSLNGIPKVQYQLKNKKIEDFVSQCKNRDNQIKLAYQSGEFTLLELGKHFGLHYSTISRIAKK